MVQGLSKTEGVMYHDFLVKLYGYKLVTTVSNYELLRPHPGLPCLHPLAEVNIYNFHT